MTQQKLLSPRLMELKKEALLQKKEAKESGSNELLVKAETAARMIPAIGAAFKQMQVDERLTELTVDQEMSILVKMVKQRKDSVEQFTKGGAMDRAMAEQAEIEYIEQFMPKAMSEDEVIVEVEKAIAETGATEMKQMGQVMGKLQHLKGRTDFGKLSGLVRSKLA